MTRERDGITFIALKVLPTARKDFDEQRPWLGHLVTELVNIGYDLSKPIWEGHCDCDPMVEPR